MNHEQSIRTESNSLQGANSILRKGDLLLYRTRGFLNFEKLSCCKNKQFMVDQHGCFWVREIGKGGREYFRPARISVQAVYVVKKVLKPYIENKQPIPSYIIYGLRMMINKDRVAHCEEFPFNSLEEVNNISNVDLYRYYILSVIAGINFIDYLRSKIRFVSARKT
jgi:hypothetical protein